MSPRKTLDDIVFENGLTDILRLERARRESISRGTPLASTLIDLGFVEQRVLARVVAAVTGCPLVDPIPEDAVASLQGRLPATIARDAMAVPVGLEGNRLTVALLDPTLENVVAVLADTTGLEIVPAVAVREPLESLVDRYYPDPEIHSGDLTLLGARGPRRVPDNNSIDLTAEPLEEDIFSQNLFDLDSPEATVAAPPDSHGTVMVAPAKRKSGDTTAPRGSVPKQPIETRIENAEAKLVDVVRALVDIQARLDAIEARLKRLPDS